MNLIWLTPEFPSSAKNTQGMYIYRTVKELSRYYKLDVICLYPAAPPVLEMIKNWKDRKTIYKNWKRNYSEDSSSKLELQNVRVYYLQYYRLPRGKFHHTEGWFVYFQLRKYLKKIISKDTIIHANWIFPAGTLANIISNKYKTPFLISLLGSDVNRLKKGTTFWKYAKNLLDKADKVTAVTDDLFEKCSKIGIPIEETKKELIDNIYETDKFTIQSKNEARKALNIEMSSKIIFFAGALVPVKNVDILIEASSTLITNSNNTYLYIAGSGIDEGKYKRLAAKLKISEKVVFLGAVIAEDLINYYNAADLLCLQSKSEGLPNVIVESFLCGTPVVASDVGGISRIVASGINGFLVKPNSVEDLKEKIEVSLNKEWNRNEIRESVDFLFPEKVIEKYHQIYKSMVDNFKCNK